MSHFRLFHFAFALLAGVFASEHAAAQGYGAGPGNLNRGVVSDRVGAQVGGGIADSIASRMIRLTLSVERTKGRFAQFHYQPDRVLLQSFDDGQVIVWDFDRSAQIAEFRMDGAARPVAYDRSGARLLVLREGSLHALQSSGDGRQAPIAEGFPASAAVLGAARVVLLGGADGSTARIDARGALTRGRKQFDAPVTQIVADAGSRRFAALAANHEAKFFDERDQVVTSLRDVVELSAFGRNGTIAARLVSGQIITVARGGATTTHAPAARVQSISLNTGGTRLLVVTESGEVNAGWGTQWQAVDSGARAAAFVSEQRFISARADGVLHLRELGLPHYLVAVVPASAGWVIVDHEGRYDGTVDGTKDVKWNAEKGKLDLDQFFQTYYQPGLLAAYVGDQEKKALPTVPANTGQGVFPPAKLELEFPDGRMQSGQAMKVVAVAESNGGELPEDIRLYHNGKRLPEKTRIGSQRVARDNRILLVQVFSFTPEGGVNEVFGEVRNAHGVATRSEIKRETTDGFRSQGRLYVLGTGIDKYRNPDINLDFAAGDVQAIVKNIGSASGATHKETLPVLVLDARATRKEVRMQLAQLEKLNPEDSVVLIFAGHGFAQDGEWYFLPHDADPRRLAATAISAKEIQDALVNAPPKRIFMMVDACNAGAGIDSFNRFRAFQRRFVQDVGRNAGITVLTATRRDQQAAELPELGHGVFTHTILQGLRGQAAKDGDGRISAHQLANYVGENLEKVARPYLSGEGLNQTPAHFVIGADFVLGEVRK